MQPTTHSQLFFREQLLLPLHHLIDLLNIQRNILHIITPLDAPIREDTLCNAACTEGYDRLQFLHNQNIVYAIFPVPSPRFQNYRTYFSAGRDNKAAWKACVRPPLRSASFHPYYGWKIPDARPYNGAVWKPV